jgi:hypothetical protein
MTLTTYAHVIRELKGEPVVSAEEQIEEARRGVGFEGGSVNGEVEAGEWRRTRGSRRRRVPIRIREVYVALVRGRPIVRRIWL